MIDADAGVYGKWSIFVKNNHKRQDWEEVASSAEGADHGQVSEETP